MGVVRRLSWVGVLALVGCGQIPNHTTGLALEGQSCFSCHGDRYLATTNPDHAALGYPTTCEACHGTAAWVPASAGNHDFWPLTGTHEIGALSSTGVQTSCESCHASGYSGTPTQCDGCHHPDFVGTTDPNHVAESFPTSCEDCHTTDRWQGASVNHDFWPLTGTHQIGALSSVGVQTSCQSCRADGYSGTPTQCDDCHHAEYAGTTDPNHATAGYPTTCKDCHGTDRWQGASVNHDFWPLVGVHKIGALSSTGITTSCESCHSASVPYNQTPTQCDSCHHPDYQATSSPNHAQVGIPTSCEQCHNPSGWATSTFPQHESLFPITTGKHRNFSCGECHTTANSYSDFTCTGCHTGEHQLSRMNAKHQGEVSGYQSTLDQYGVERGCLHCHPDGREHDD